MKEQIAVDLSTSPVSIILVAKIVFRGAVAACLLGTKVKKVEHTENGFSIDF